MEIRKLGACSLQATDSGLYDVLPLAEPANLMQTSIVAHKNQTGMLTHQTCPSMQASDRISMCVPSGHVTVPLPWAFPACALHDSILDYGLVCLRLLSAGGVCCKQCDGFGVK
jgi:hypothetical protein